MSKNIYSFYYMQRLMRSLPFHFVSLTKRFTDSIGWKNHLPFDNMARSLHRDALLIHAPFLSKKGYNAKSLPVVVLRFWWVSATLLRKYISKISSWIHDGDGAALPSRCCMLHITNTAHCCRAMYMYDCLTTGPVFLPLASHTSNDPYYSNQKCYMQQQQQH